MIEKDGVFLDVFQYLNRFLKCMPYFNKLIADISPLEFEFFVRNHLEAFGSNLKSYEVLHNQKVVAFDGVYQIDVKAVFEALGVNFTVLVECKHQKSRIKREIVEIIFNRIASVGAQKGMIFSSSGFQSGAIQYAAAHGIALIQVVEGKYTYHVKSEQEMNYDEIDMYPDTPRYVGYLTYNGLNGMNTVVQ